MQQSLLVGCGKNLTKQLYLVDQPREWAGNLVTMDMNPEIGADVVFDMEELHGNPRGKLPFPDSSFDEIGCFNAMEHWGRQGDWRGWFYEMGEFHRILKPGGQMFILVPIGEDRFADPGHTRFFQMNHFGFLSQKFYEQNAVLKSSFTDYRWYWKKDFDILVLQEHEGHHLGVILRRPA